MTVRLSRSDEAYVRRKVESGEYASEAAYVAHAISLARQIEKARVEELRKEIDAGIRDEQAGRFVDWEVEAVKRALVGKSRKAS
jgi:putative addiction module CopG family antidote